jgi:hypothetical protein
MDWSKQTQEMMQSWNEAQKRMWDNWLQGLQGTKEGGTTDAWQKALETWQKSVSETFDAQARMMKLWLENLKKAQTGPEATKEWIKQFEQMTEQVTASQRQLWDSCFATLKKADLRKMPGTWEQDAKHIFQGWQAATRKVIEAQLGLLSNWTKGSRSGG